MDKFVCAECQAKYVVTRSDELSAFAPTCEQCGRPFPDEANGDWLHYERQNLDGTRVGPLSWRLAALSSLYADQAAGAATKIPRQ